MLIENVKKENYVQTAYLGDLWNYYSSSTTPPRDTAQVSMERRNSALEHHGVFFQFSFWDLEIFRDYVSITKKIVFFNFFL